MLVFICIHLDSPIEDLAFWPTPEQTLSYKHPHFSGDFTKINKVGDCTEQWIQRSQNSNAQYQTYSTYKSHNTFKKLVICTKQGSINYISDAKVGSATDRLITEDTNRASQFTPSYSFLFDKEFNVQELIFKYKVAARIPPFVRSKKTAQTIKSCSQKANSKGHDSYRTCTRFFYEQWVFSTQPQCCLTFIWIELQMLLRCCLIHVGIIILRHLFIYYIQVHV